MFNYNSQLVASSTSPDHLLVLVPELLHGNTSMMLPGVLLFPALQMLRQVVQDNSVLFLRRKTLLNIMVPAPKDIFVLLQVASTRFTWQQMTSQNCG